MFQKTSCNTCSHLKSGTLFFVAAITISGYAQSYPYAEYYRNVPFDMLHIQQLDIPNRSISITDCGGIGDGQTLNTAAFATAMELLAAQGGGTLNVPAGIWHTGPIVFKSNINLHLETGALLLFTNDKNAYPLTETSFEGIETRRAQSPVSGKNLENIAITGHGAINGQGDSWRPVKKGKVTETQWKRFLAAGGILKDPNYWFPSESSLRGEQLGQQYGGGNVPHIEMSDTDWQAVRDYMRPVMIQFTNCRNILLQDVLFENSPSWNLHPLMCENLIIEGITVRNPPYAQNGDGVDIESCRNVLVINSTFDVGDDAICLKSGKDDGGRKRAMPTENVIVANCRTFNGHGGFVVGSEMSGGVRNVSVQNCQFIGTDVGLRFKSARGRGGIVENIFIDGIYMFNITTDAFLFDLYYGTPINNYVIPPVTEETPVFRNIHVQNIMVHKARRAMFFNGLPEMNISNVQVENAVISADYGAELSEADSIILHKIRILPKEGPALILNNVKNAQVSDFSTDNSITQPIRICGERSAHIQFLPEK